MENVIVKMPTGEDILVETYDKNELMELLKKIEEVLKLTDEIMEGCYSTELTKMIFDFFNSSSAVVDYSEFENSIDYDFKNII